MQFRSRLTTIIASLVLAGAARGAAAQITRTEYAERRAALLGGLQDGVVLALGAREPTEDYVSFYQTTPFTYLTGYAEPNAALLLIKENGRSSAMLFVEERDPAAEVWTGRRLGPAGATGATGIPARPREELTSVLDSLLTTVQRLHVVGDVRPSSEDGDSGRVLSADEQFIRRITAAHASVKVTSANRELARLRGRKSKAELDLIRKAAAITADAQREAMRALEPDMNEFEIQGLIEYTFRRNGADRPSFATIVASGPNATILHYNADDRFMAASEVVVMDIGASYRGYAADVTRTVPVSGTFTSEQRLIYQIVRDAQAAAERQAKPGARAALMSDSAAATLAAGLARVGLIESPNATYDCGSAREPQQCPQLGLYYMHAVGHGIGLDVHDPDQASFTGTLAPGSAFTIEPGIYIRSNVLDLLPKTRRNGTLIARLRPSVERFTNIGVRIEDDYVVTADGVEWVSRAPREAAEVEAMMRETPTVATGRDSTKVGWYRRTGGPQTP